MKRLPFIAVVVCLICVAANASAEEIEIRYNPHNLSLERWTAEDFANAKPLPLPRVEGIVGAKREAPPELFLQEVVVSEAVEPTLSVEERSAFRRILHEPKAVDEPDVETSLNPPVKNRGNSQLDYTSSRLIPSSAVETFPYSAVGKLFFYDDAGDAYYCTAAVITYRLIITASQCLHGGPDGNWYHDFVFVPAYRDGEAPYGSWEFSHAYAMGDWTETGELPNPSDWGFLAMRDQDGHRISEVTGKLGCIVGRTAPNHLHLLGYPEAFDGGQEMHQVTSGAFLFYPQNTVVYGSDMGSGSTGGPWIQNFNRKSQGQGGGRNKARAAVVGVASFTTDPPGPRIQGTSTFNTFFRVVLGLTCDDQPGNC